MKLYYLTRYRAGQHFSAILAILLLWIFCLDALAQPVPLEHSCPQRFAAFVTKQSKDTYGNFYSDTLQGIEAMRNPETGLIRDKILVREAKNGKVYIKVLNNNTSATNIALDLLNQISRVSDSHSKKLALLNLNKNLDALEQMSFHKDSGLFYSWYNTNKGMKPQSLDVSSVDNIHLSLALWTLKETFPGTDLAKKADKLFSRMDFSAFYDQSTGLMGGNLKHTNNKWELEAYRFATLGSETRSIYALSWALGLLKKTPDKKFPEKSLQAMTSEYFSWNSGGETKKILRTWDGGAFQLLLPQILIKESDYSPELAKTFQNYASYIVSEGKRQGLSVPAAHSASAYGLEGKSALPGVPDYHGKAGSPQLVSTRHEEINDPKYKYLWDYAFTPHAAVLAATADPKNFEPILKQVKEAPTSKSIYIEGLGFMDALVLKGPQKGEVVPVQLSLNQGMIAMSLKQMQATDGLSPSARALSRNPEVRSRLQDFYKLLNQKLEQTN